MEWEEATFDEKWHNEGQTEMEDIFEWKNIFDGRQSLMEHNLRLKNQLYIIPDLILPQSLFYYSASVSLDNCKASTCPNFLKL